MTWLDYALIAVVGLSALVGIWRGLVREVFALAGWVAAIAVAMLFAGEAAKLIPSGFATPLVRTVIAFTLLFVVILVTVSIAGLLFTKAVRAVGLGACRPDARGGLRIRPGRPHIAGARPGGGADGRTEGAVLAGGEARPAARNRGDCGETLPSARLGG